jgi:hypothetical protein
MLRPAGLRTFDTLQTCVAAVVFTSLLAANPVAYALYHNPGSEWLWRLSIPLNRAAEPVSQFILRFTLHTVLASLALLALILAFSIFSYAKRFWLGIAITGHVALGGLAMMVWNLADRVSRNTMTAMAGDFWYADPSKLNTHVLVAGTILAVMFVLCILNHIVFFRHQTVTAKNDRSRNRH